MGRAKSKVQTWESIVEELGQEESRHIIRRTKQTPFIQVRDTTDKTSQASLRPLRAWGGIEDVVRARDLVLFIGDRSWPKEVSIEALLRRSEQGEDVNTAHISYTWLQVQEATLDHLTKTMKGSSSKNIRADLNNLVINEVPFKWTEIRSWVFEKAIETRPFKNRLDSLEQIRLALATKFGEEPEWLKRADLDGLRDQFNRSKKKKERYQPGKDIGGIRGIPTKEEAEEYLDRIGISYPLEQWCLAMMLNYGLRNHELHHIEPITKAGTKLKMQGGWVLVPGEWRTKSKLEHWTWPLYPSWIKRYNLSEKFKEYQDLLRTHAQMKIVSARDKSKPWNPNDDGDLGVCDNNDYLGNWISKRMREELPNWPASIPNASGQKIRTAKKQNLSPYDLRHTWAIRMATDPRWSNVSDSDAAAAMGHDLETHRKHYQKWISNEENRVKVMSKITLPSD